MLHENPGGTSAAAKGRIEKILPALSIVTTPNMTCGQVLIRGSSRNRVGKLMG